MRETAVKRISFFLEFFMLYEFYGVPNFSLTNFLLPCLYFIFASLNGIENGRLSFETKLEAFDRSPHLPPGEHKKFSTPNQILNLIQN